MAGQRKQQSAPPAVRKPSRHKALLALTTPAKGTRPVNFHGTTIYVPRKKEEKTTWPPLEQ